MMVRFFKAYPSARDGADMAASAARAGADPLVQRRHPREGYRPAPTTEATLVSLSAQTAATLDEARRQQYPDAPVFRADNLGRLVAKALATEQFEIAESIADFARRVYPASMPLLDASSEAREGRGDRAGAADLAARCAASPAGR